MFNIKIWHKRMQKIASFEKQTIILLFIIDYIHGTKGGTENQLIKLINGLDKKKYYIHLLALFDTEWISQSGSQVKCEKKVLKFKNLRDVKSVIHFYRMVRYIIQIRPDIVVTYFPISNIIGAFVARLAGVRIIVSSRRDFGLWLENQRELMFLKMANKLVDKIIVNSKVIRDLVCREEHVDISKISVIYNGINTSTVGEIYIDSVSIKKQLGISMSDKVVGIVGGLRPMKRHYTFVNASHEILKIRQDIHFIIIGDGPMRRALEEQVEALGIKNNVHFAGAQNDIRPYLSILDIGVNCSANEGLSNAIMEYMAYGIPCIVSRAGGNEELIKDGVNGLTFKLDDHLELSGHIQTLLNDQDRRLRYIYESKRIIETMSVEKMIFNYESCFEMLIRQANGASY